MCTNVLFYFTNIARNLMNITQHTNGMTTVIQRKGDDSLHHVTRSALSVRPLLQPLYKCWLQTQPVTYLPTHYRIGSNGKLRHLLE